MAREIRVEIVGDARSLEAALGKAQTASMRFQRGLEPVARGAKIALLGIGALGAASVKLSNDFNRTASQIVGLAGVGTEQVEEWKGALLDLAPVVGKAPDELAKALYFVSSSGVKASQALDVVKVSAKAASAGLGETEVVADAVTSAMNAYAKEGLSAAQATDVLVATVREGKGEAADIAPVLGNVIPVAAQLGVGFEEVGAAMASMTRLGFDAATASTNLSGVLSALLKPQKQAEEGFKAVGTSSAELQKMLAGRGLLATLQFLEDRFKGNNAAMAKAFPNIRALRGVLSLVGKAGEDTAGVFKKMEDNTGSLGTAFKAVSETDSFKLQQSFAQIQASGIKMGAALAPVVSDMASGLARAADFAGDHEQATRALAAAIAALSVTIIAANSALKIYNSNLARATGLQPALLAIGRAAGPIGLAAVAIGAAAYAIKRVGGASEEAENSVRSFNAAIRETQAASGALNQSASELANSRLGERAAVLNLKEATHALNQIEKDETATALQRKQAKLQVAQAEQALADATQRRVSAEVDNHAKQKSYRVAEEKQIDGLQKLIQNYQEAADAATGYKKGQGGVAAGGEDATKALGNLKAELRNVESGATGATPKVRDLAGKILDMVEAQKQVDPETVIKFLLNNYTPAKRGIEDIRAAAENAAGNYGINFIVQTHGSINAPTGVTAGGGFGGAPRVSGGGVAPRVSGGVAHIHLNVDGKEVASRIVEIDKVFRRQNGGRPLFA